MDRLMLSDKDLEVVDWVRYQTIGMMLEAYNKPTRREFVSSNGIKEPVNSYFQGGRFNISQDVFKIISIRTRGKKYTMVVRFEGVLD